MAYIKKTNLFKRILFSRSMALGLLLVIIFVGYGLVSLIGKSIEAAKARRLSEDQAASLTQKENDLTKKLALLNTPDGKEAILREQFPVVKPGEQVVVITDENQSAAAAAAAQEQPPKKGFWNFIKSLFGE